MNHTEIRFLVRSKISGKFYRKGSWQTGKGWYKSPFDATLFTADSIKHLSKLQHNHHAKDVEVLEVDASVTDHFAQPPEDSNGR